MRERSRLREVEASETRAVNALLAGLQALTVAGCLVDGDRVPVAGAEITILRSAFGSVPWAQEYLRACVAVEAVVRTDAAGRFAWTPPVAGEAWAIVASSDTTQSDVLWPVVDGDDLVITGRPRRDLSFTVDAIPEYLPRPIHVRAEVRRAHPGDAASPVSGMLSSQCPFVVWPARIPVREGRCLAPCDAPTLYVEDAQGTRWRDADPRLLWIEPDASDVFVGSFRPPDNTAGGSIVHTFMRGVLYESDDSGRFVALPWEHPLLAYSSLGIDQAMKPDSDVVMHKGREVRATLVDGAGRRLDGRATLVVTHKYYINASTWAVLLASSDNEGRLSIRVLDGSPVFYTQVGRSFVRWQRYLPLLGDVDLGEITLAPRVLAGVVIGEDGAPAQRCMVRVRPVADRVELPEWLGAFFIGEQVAFTDARGRFVFHAVQAGEYDAMVVPGSGAVAFERVVVARDEDVSIRVTCRRPIAISGRIVGGGARPVDEWIVARFVKAPTRFRRFGVYEFDGVVRPDRSFELRCLDDAERVVLDYYVKERGADGQEYRVYDVAPGTSGIEIRRDS